MLADLRLGLGEGLPAEAVDLGRLTLAARELLDLVEARDRQKDSNVDEMLLNSISAHRQSVFKFFESPFWDPINRGESQPIELATPYMV